MNGEIRIFGLVALLSVSLIIPNSVFAEQVETEMDSGASLIDENYIQNEEYYKGLEKAKDEQIEKEEQVFQGKRMAARANEYYTINVPHKKQEHFNFCGVAAGVQTLAFHKAKSGDSTKLPEQKTFGWTIGVLPEKSGTTSTSLATGLNAYKTTYGFKSNPYIVGNIAQFDKPAVTLENRVKNTLRAKTNAPILLLHTEKLSRYVLAPKNYRHYVIVSGYDQGKDQFRLVDSNHVTVIDKNTNNKVAFGGIYWSKLGTTGSAKGVARAVFEANIKTAKNPVMVW